MSPGKKRLLRVPLDRLHPHPANANLMSEERLEKLARNIAREENYPPIVVRPHPELPDEYEILDGHQRAEVLRRLGHAEALCFLWPCDDATALMLLATLNRLEGEDVPAFRAGLLSQLTEVLSMEQMAALLPEDEQAIKETIELLSLDTEALLAELTAAAERNAQAAPRLISFAVSPEDEPVIEEAVKAASIRLSGKNRRGRALGAICRNYMEAQDARDG